VDRGRPLKAVVARPGGSGGAEGRALAAKMADARCRAIDDPDRAERAALA
jgi:hypothetical protein